MGSRRIGLARSGLRANPRDRRDITTSTGEVLPHARFFVPAFSVRRQLVPNQDALDFAENLEAYCAKRPYKPLPVEEMGITLMEKGRFVDMFLTADVQPEAQDTLRLAVNVREALHSATKSKPHTLSVPLGGVAVFGKNDNKISATLKGWKGFGASYAARDDAGKLLANRQIVGEINTVVGEVAQFVDGGIDGNGEYVTVSTRPIQRQTPHLTFAEKTRGSVGNDERANMAGQVMEFMPGELQFFDPVIRLQLQTPGNNRTGFTNNMGEASVESSGLYIRRPKFRNFGGTALEQCITTGAA